MLLLLGALGLACSPESAFSQEKAAAQAYAGKTVTGEVTVKQTVEDTLQSHRGLKVMQENLDVVRHELRRAKAGWGPSVDAVGRTGASRLSNTTTRPLNADKDMYGANSISLTLTQPLWDGFATRSRVRTGEATVDSMTYRVLDNATSFALDAIIAHVDLLRRREILQLAKDNVRQHVEILDSQKERVELGAGSSADVTQTKGRLARAQSTLTDAEASLREGEASYIRLTGKPVPASLAEVYVPEPMYTGYDAVMEVADKNNPKLKAYMSDIKAARGEKELAESAYHPKINFEVGPSYSDRSGPGSQWTSGVDAGLACAGTCSTAGRTRPEPKPPSRVQGWPRRRCIISTTNWLWKSKIHGPGIWRPRNRRSIMRKPSATTRRRATRISSSSSWAKEACSTCLMRKASFSTRPRSTRQPMATWL